MADVNAEDVKEKVEHGTTAEDSSTKEIESLDFDDTDGDELDEDEQPEKGADAKNENDTEETESDNEQSKNNAETRKEKLNEEIRELVNRKNTLRQEIEVETAKLVRAKTPQELVSEGLDETHAELESIRQERAIERYNNIVAQNTTAVNEESLRVLRDFPIFDKRSSEYDQELAAEVESLYRKASGLRINEQNGLVEDVKLLPYDFYKTFAKAIERGSKAAAPKAQRIAERQLASSDTYGSASRSSDKDEKDPADEVFDEVFGD